MKNIDRKKFNIELFHGLVCKTKELVWKASKICNLTLIQNIRIKETKKICNQGFVYQLKASKMSKYVK